MKDLRTCLLGQPTQMIVWNAMCTVENPDCHGIQSQGALRRVILQGSYGEITDDSMDGSKMNKFEIPVGKSSESI